MHHAFPTDVRLSRRRWLAGAAGTFAALAAPAYAQSALLPTLPASELATEAPPVPALAGAGNPVNGAAPPASGPVPNARSRSSLRIELPYTPSEAVVAQVDAQPTWMEVYGCPPGRVAALVASLKRGEIPSTTVAIGVVEALNLRTGGEELRLSQVRAALTRGGSPVLYDEQCRVRPQRGDRLAVRYERGELAVELTASLVAAVSLGLAHPFAEELSALDTARPEHCKAEVEQRLYYAGRMVLMRAGRRLDARDVLVQTITEL